MMAIIGMFFQASTRPWYLGGFGIEGFSFGVTWGSGFRLRLEIAQGLYSEFCFQFNRSTPLCQPNH